MTKKRSQRKGSSGRKSSASNKPQQSSGSSGGGGSESAASRTRARREAREAERKRRRNITYIIGAAIAAIVVIGVIIIIRQPQDAPIPSSIEDLAGIPQTTDENGFPVLGDPDAPVRVTEYSSFSCPVCGAWHNDNWDRMLREIRDGVVAFTFVPLQTGAIPNAGGATRAAYCAGEQGEFWEFHEALFSWQRSFGNQAFTQQRLDTGVENFGFDVSAFNSCRSSSEASQFVSAGNSNAAGRGINSTPSFLVQNQPVAQNEVFGRIDTVLENWLQQNPDRPPVAIPFPGEESDETEVPAEETEAAEATTEASSADEATPEVTEEAMDETEATEEASDEAEETEEAAGTSGEAEAEATEEAADMTDDEMSETEATEEAADMTDEEMSETEATEEAADMADDEMSEAEATEEAGDMADDEMPEDDTEEAGIPGVIIFP